MTPLQEAAKAARDKLKMPKCRKCRDCPSCRGSGLRGCLCRCECPECYGTGKRHEENPDGDDFSERQPVAEDFINPRCAACSGCGVDVSIPHALIGAGIAALVATGRSVEIRTDSVWVKNGDEHVHHGIPTPTPEWIAVAVLRLVARCAP